MNTYLYNIIIIIVIDFTNPDKTDKIRKSWSSGNPDCLFKTNIPANIYFFKVNNRNTKKKKVWNMFKVNNKNTRTTSMMSFSCFYC